MQGRIDDRLLMAYADGELAGDARRAVEDYLRAHPEALQAIQAQQRLNRAAQRSIRADTPAVPRHLRSAVEQILRNEPGPPVESPARPREWSRPGRHRVLAAVACLAIAVGAVLWLMMASVSLLPSGGPSAGKATPPYDGTLSAQLTSSVTQVHEKCARLIDHFIAPEFGASLRELPAPAEQFLGTSPSLPDLSAFDYEFNGAGPCNVPGGKTLHVLYRSRSDPAKNISVFIQRDQGQLSISANQLHTAEGTGGGAPVLVWRTKGLVYYVIGDEPVSARNAAHLISSAAGA